MTPPVDPFAALVAVLGQPPPPPPSGAEETARRLGRAAEVLRESGDPDALAVAAAFDRWLGSGGDLAQLLGARARRGRRHDVPAHHRRQLRRDFMVRSLAEDLLEPGMSERAHLARLVECLRTPKVASMVREISGAEAVPTSPTRLRAILRAG